MFGPVDIASIPRFQAGSIAGTPLEPLAQAVFLAFVGSSGPSNPH